LSLRDRSNIELVLKVLQMMCEGHNRDLQEYLREQPDNIRSIDLVTLTVELLHVVAEKINGDTIHQIDQV
jgi:hypothetical protein